MAEISREQAQNKDRVLLQHENLYFITVSKWCIEGTYQKKNHEEQVKTFAKKVRLFQLISRAKGYYWALLLTENIKYEPIFKGKVVMRLNQEFWLVAHFAGILQHWPFQRKQPCILILESWKIQDDLGQKFLPCSVSTKLLAYNPKNTCRISLISGGTMAPITSILNPHHLNK